MAPPLVLDVDGTLTRPDRPGIDPRVFDPIAEWPAPVVVATGKAVPYPVALCEFVATPVLVVAENGGVVVVDDEVTVLGDAGAPRAALEALREAGHDLVWGLDHPVNRWRETEVAIDRSLPEAAVRAAAEEFDLVTIDSGYAYHMVLPDVDKGRGLQRIATALDLDASAFVAVGDSENDVPTFEVVDRSFAVANADDAARAAADEVLDGAHADGTLSVLDRLRSA